MPALVSPLRAWLAALLADESGVLRADRFPVDLGAASYPLINEDRACEVRYAGGDLRPFAGSCRRAVITFNVRVAYRFATEPAMVGAADGDALVSTAEDRCADDAAAIRETCLDASLYETIAAGWTVIMLTPGVHTIEQGEGVVIGTLPVVMVASYSPANVTVGAALG